MSGCKGIDLHLAIAFGHELVFKSVFCDKCAEVREEVSINGLKECCTTGTIIVEG